MKSRLSQKKYYRFIVFLLLGFVLLGVILYASEKLSITDFIKMPQAEKQSSASEQKKAEEKAANEAKQAFLDSAVEPTTNQPTTQTQAEETVNLTLSAAQEGDTVTILTKVFGLSSGECMLKIQNGNLNTSQKAQLIYQPEFSSCAGFSLKNSVLGFGKWQITVEVIGPETISRTISLEVSS